MNEKRVILMTKLANYEQKHKRQLQEAGGYYRSDYIGIQLLKNFFRVTVIYLIGLIFWCCYHFEELMEKLNTMDLKGTVRGMLIVYLLLAAAWLLITYIAGTIWFYRGEKIRQTYRNMLGHLLMEYDCERPLRPKRREKNRKHGGTDYDTTVEL
jgi:hypothetical protein